MRGMGAHHAASASVHAPAALWPSVVSAGWLLVVAVIAGAAGASRASPFWPRRRRDGRRPAGWRVQSARRWSSALGLEEQLHGTAATSTRSPAGLPGGPSCPPRRDPRPPAHDREKILEAVSATAQLAVGAQRVHLLRVRPGPEGPRGPVGLGPGAPSSRRLRLGTGLAGRPGRHPGRRHGCIRATPGALPVFPEPEVATAMAVPFSTRGQLCSAWWPSTAIPPADLRRTTTSRRSETLVAQAGTAVDNVSLHEEAQRLSITDGLTGLWNRRQLDLRCQEELERAVRFSRPVGVVFCDVDLFKDVNDASGTTRAATPSWWRWPSRLAAATREIDVVARYGGEEFVLLLPGNRPGRHDRSWPRRCAGRCARSRWSTTAGPARSPCRWALPPIPTAGLASAHCSTPARRPSTGPRRTAATALSIRRSMSTLSSSTGSLRARSRRSQPPALPMERGCPGRRFTIRPLIRSSHRPDRPPAETGAAGSATSTVHRPVGQPGLLLVQGERLLPVGRRRGDVRPQEAHPDLLALVLVVREELTPAVR